MILSSGEALIDFVSRHDNPQLYESRPGGSPFNVAIALARLGTEVSFFTRLSTDYYGDMLVNQLNANGVHTDRILRVPGETTMAFVFFPSGANDPQFELYTNGTVDCSLPMDAIPSTLPDGFTTLNFGSVSLMVEPGASTYEAMMQRYSGQRIISLDPNIRPKLIHDRDAYRKRFEGWLKLVDIVKLGEADLKWLYPGEAPRTVVERLLGSGPSLFLLTLGDEGAEIYTPKGFGASAKAPAVKVADTVGAGDTFLASTLAFLDQNNVLQKREQLKDLPEALLASCASYAAMAAALNCTRVGADPPTHAEVTAALNA